MEALFKSCNICCVDILQNNKLQISLGKVELFFYLLHVVTHPGKLHCYHVVLVRYGLACPKFSEIINYNISGKD